ncbi:MAG TPA: biotin transporter BioY [Bacteroidota bacterium]|nr:biotin transporter BioY [Bacteroidota bacterium]
MNDSSNLVLGKTADSSRTIAVLFWVALFAAGTALSARLEIPHQPVPYTLQTLMVLLAGAFLGPKNGMLSQLAYLAAGILGAPVFAGGGAGILSIVGPSGGYLLSFPLAALVVGYFTGKRHTLLRVALSMGAGLVVVFTIGALYLGVFYTHRFESALQAGVLIFSWWDLLKLSAASMIYFEMGKRWRRVPR